MRGDRSGIDMSVDHLGNYSHQGGDDWIKGATKNKGGLHRSLGIPEGQKIPESKIEAATHSSNPKIKKQADLAETLKGMKR